MIVVYFAYDERRKVEVEHRHLTGRMMPPYHPPLLEIRVRGLLVLLVGDEALAEELAKVIHAGLVV